MKDTAVEKLARIIEREEWALERLLSWTAEARGGDDVSNKIVAFVLGQLAKGENDEVDGPISKLVRSVEQHSVVLGQKELF